MRLLLDTHILIGLSRGSLARTQRAIAAARASGEHDLAASVASLWEIAIKARLGKLDPGVPLHGVAAFWRTAGLAILPIDHHHAVAEI